MPVVAHLIAPSHIWENEPISLKIHLPTFGTIFMKPPDDPLWPHARSEELPRDDQLLSGVLEIHVPLTSSGAGRRCKSVRVGIRTIVRLNMGSGRGWEEDVIFERRVEMLGGNSDGITLHEGVQLFEFTLIIPSSLAPHDWHSDGKVIQEVFAILKGVPQPESTTFSALSLFGFGRRRSSVSSQSSRAPALSRRSSTSSSSPSSAPLISPMLSDAGSLSISRQEDARCPFAPSYNQSQATADSLSGSTEPSAEWITGTVETVQSVMVMHNPNPSGDANDLDIRQNGFSLGVGIWDLKIFSDVFSIGGPITISINLPSLNPCTTIFSWRLVVRQTHTVTSPRDDPKKSKPLHPFRLFVITERGVRPLYIRNPGKDVAAVWRGTGAGGMNEGECLMGGSANMPRDDCGRPTTLPGIVTPIKVSHVLWFQVFFSVWGEDDRGKPMPTPGPGGMRSLQVSKPLILPSCALIPSLLDLPKYQQLPSIEPCETCDDPLNSPICLSCPPKSTVDALHPPSILNSGSTNNDQSKKAHPCRVTLCAECSPKHDSTEFDTHGWKLCACGLAAGDIAERMKMFATVGTAAGGHSVEEMEARGRKEVAERGQRGSARAGNLA